VGFVCPRMLRCRSRQVAVLTVVHPRRAPDEESTVAESVERVQTVQLQATDGSAGSNSQAILHTSLRVDRLLRVGCLVIISSSPAAGPGGRSFSLDQARPRDQAGTESACPSSSISVNVTVTAAAKRSSQWAPSVSISLTLKRMAVSSLATNFHSLQMSARPPPPLPPGPPVTSSGDLERLHDDCRRGHKSSVYDAIGDTPALVNQKGNLGFTALMYAAHAGHVDIVELLLHSKADPNAQNDSGDTALHLASAKKRTLVVQALLNENINARTDLRNRDGKTAEDLALSDEVRDAFNKQSDIIQMAPEESDDDDDE
jgi:hypothetical protein